MIHANKKILDPCCGSKMFWFDKCNPNTIYGDMRDEEHVLCDGRSLQIKPDYQMDFTNLPFTDGIFKLVVFDPPHLIRAGEKGWMMKKYGRLSGSWRNDIATGFRECFRVLEPDGILIFKWNSIQIKTSEILSLTDKKPLFGHPSGKRANTHWICFMNICPEVELNIVPTGENW